MIDKFFVTTPCIRIYNRFLRWLSRSAAVVDEIINDGYESLLYRYYFSLLMNNKYAFCNHRSYQSIVIRVIQERDWCKSK